jgi:hypothetical protein
MRPDQLLQVVTARLEALGIAYCVGGSFASSVYGQARNTYDLDILVQLQPEYAAGLVASFAGDFDVDLAEVLDAIVQAPAFRDTPAYRAMAKMYEKRTAFRVYLILSRGGRLAGPPAPAAHPPDHRCAVDPEVQADFASPEDTILAKLEWFQLGNYASTHQWTDVRAMLLVQNDALDWAYLRHWADVLEVRVLLERAVAGEQAPSSRAPTRPDELDSEQLRLF